MPLLVDNVTPISPTQLALGDPNTADVIRHYTEELKRQGFVIFREFFPPSLIEKAHKEINAIFDAMMADRQRRNITSLHDKDSAICTSVATKEYQIAVDIFTQSPTYNELFEQFLTHPVTRCVLENLLGPHIKLRGYNVRRMTGEPDTRPFPEKASSLPLEWHSDAPYETCVSILLTDVPTLDDAPTALIPGSHLFPYPKPDKHNVFSRNNGAHPWFIEHNLFNTLLAHQVFPRTTGSNGQAGDVVLFINDMWHGRHPNLHGRQSMLSFIGLFATCDDFPDEVTVPSQDVLNQLPPRMREVVGHTLPVIPNDTAYIKQMMKERQPLKPLSLFHLAKLERIVLEKVSQRLMKWRLLK